MNKLFSRMFHRPLVTLVAVALLVTCLPTKAFADHENEEAGVGLLLTTTLGGLTTTGLGVWLTIHLVNKNKKEAMKTYIRHNATAMRRDITMGGGDTVDDLAEAFRVPENQHADFGQALRDKRETLVTLADAETITEQRAGLFVATVQSAMNEHDVEPTRSVDHSYASP